MGAASSTAEQSAHNRQVRGSNPRRPTISAIVPSWTAWRYLPACLMALGAQLDPDDEIIVVDNGSVAGVAGRIAAKQPGVRVVRLATNQGFAGGVNVGIGAAQGDWLLLCNDDALLEPGAVAQLCAAMAAEPSVGAVAGVLTFSHIPSYVASAGISVHTDGIALDRCLGWRREELPITPQPVFGASGGFALVRRALLDDVGLFHEPFFCYLEDVDLAWRAQLRGWKCLLAPTAYARHVYSASGSGVKAYLLARNRIRVLIRCVPSALLRACLPRILGYDVLACAYAALSRQYSMIRGRLAALREMPQLRAERRAIQARRTARDSDLGRWLESGYSVQTMLRLRQTLTTITTDRKIPHKYPQV